MSFAQGERGTNLDTLIDTVLKRVGEKTKTGDFDGGARTVDEALAELDRREAEQRDLARRSRIALLEEGVKVDILRHDAIAVVRRIEKLVATDHPTERPAWQSGFRQRYDAFYEESEAKGINFSLSIAIELARRMVATAHDSTERGTAANLLGIALQNLGERESGTERLEQAVAAYRAALEERTRERVPLDWATTQMNLGTALASLGERESGTERLEQAVAAYRATRFTHFTALRPVRMARRVASSCGASCAGTASARCRGSTTPSRRSIVSTLARSASTSVIRQSRTPPGPA